MTLFTPAYKLQIYQPRSVDPTEATILTPSGGAPHSDPFRVTTLPNLAGYKPYLGLPRGRRGKVDVLTRSTDIGTLDFELYDVALTPGTNASRWITAFFGDTNGDFRFSGLKCFAEESLDGGANWAAFWTGYCSRLRSMGANRWTITVRDLFWDLNRLVVFLTLPHSSVAYHARVLLLPVGVGGTGYGTVPAAADLTGSVSSPALWGDGSVLANCAFVKLDVASQARYDNLITQNLLRVLGNSQINGLWWAGASSIVVPGGWAFAGQCRATMTWNAGANTGDFIVGGVYETAWGQPTPQRRRSGKAAVNQVLIQPLLDTTDLGYSALPANGTAVSIRLWAEAVTDLGGQILLNDAHPLTVVQDMLAGKFSPAWRAPEQKPPGKVYGDIKRTFNTNISSATIPDLPSARFNITASDKALPWLQKNICKPYGVALIITGAGQIQAVDLRLPTSLGALPTLTDADLDDKASLDWQHDRDSAITRAQGVVYEDRRLSIDALGLIPDDYPDVSAFLQAPIDHPLVLLGIGSGDFGDQTFAIEGTGYRYMSGDALLAGHPRFSYVQDQLLEQLNAIRRPFAHGSCSITLTCRRTATVQALVQGQAIQATLSKLADPQTYKRGGPRILRITERTEDGIRVRLTCLDLGTASVAAVPALTSLALGTDAKHTATITLTLNGSGQPAQLRWAITGTGVGAAPADTDPSWKDHPSNPFRSTGSVTIIGLVPGQRLWVQARTFPDNRVSLQMPSAWVTSGSIDLTAYSVPGAVTVTQVAARSAVVSWTNGATDMPVEVLLSSPTSDPGTRIATLLPGSARYVLENLFPNTQYKVWIQYRSTSGVVSGSATQTFTTTSSSISIPLPPPFYRQPIQVLL